MARLVRNLEQATADLGGRAHAHSSRVILELPDEVPWEAARERVSTVFGVANFSKSHAVAANLDTLKQELVQRLGDVGPGTFRVAARRSDKQFPRTSVEIEREVGGVLKAATGRTVDLDDPQLTVHLEVLRDRILYSFEKVAGPGGFPVGTAGKVMALLSGGIDSPVAAWRMIKRGCRVVFVHFHSVPYLPDVSQHKARALVERLTEWQYRSRLFVVPFGEIQREIVLSVPGPARVVVYRRMMIRIAEALARQVGAQALVTGESLGQVASQTLENIARIDEAAGMPVFRPLIGTDKLEITAEAQRLRTFEISIEPDADCCTLFTPKHPATRLSADAVTAVERALDVAHLVQMGLGGASMASFVFPATPADPAEAAS